MSASKLPRVPKRSVIALVVAGIFAAVLLGPARPVLTSAAGVLYGAWSYGRYLVLSLPGRLWWTAIIAGVSLTAFIAVVTAGRSSLSRSPRRPSNRPGAGVRTGAPDAGIPRSAVSRLAAEIADASRSPASRGNIDRIAAEIASQALDGRRWNRAVGAKLAADPRLAEHPELAEAVRNGPVYRVEPRRNRLLRFVGRLVCPGCVTNDARRRTTVELERIDALLSSLESIV